MKIPVPKQASRILLKSFRILMLVALAFVGTACSTIRSGHEHDSTFKTNVHSMVSALQSKRGVDGLALVVVERDKILFQEGFGVTQTGEEFTEDTICGLYSATKAITAFTLAAMLEKGAFDVDVTIGEAWEGAPVAWQDIPIWRLYNHTSGIPMIINQEVFAERADDPDFGNSEIVEIIAKQPLDYQPGEFSRYRQSGYAVAEYLVSQATQTRWSELVKKHLTGPAGALKTTHGQVTRAEKNVPMITSAGGYETSARDMGLIFKAINAGDVVSEDAVSNVLLAPKYVHGDYGIGLIHETVAGIKTIGHRGGGARGNIRYAPHAKIGVMACTDQQANDELIIDVVETVLVTLAAK